MASAFVCVVCLSNSLGLRELRRSIRAVHDVGAAFIRPDLVRFDVRDRNASWIDVSGPE
jgi:hypothetical protein